MIGSPPERKGHRTAPVATPAAKGTLIPMISLASTISLSIILPKIVINLLSLSVQLHKFQTE